MSKRSHCRGRGRLAVWGRPSSQGERSRGPGLGAVRPIVLVGGVLFLAGLMLLATAFLQGPQSAAVTIPQGAPWYYEFRIEVLGPSRIAGNFAEMDGRAVDMYVFAAREYKAYELIGLGYNLFSMQGSSGSFQVDLPAGGTYYLVFDHGEGHEETAQTVRVSFRVLGIEPEFFAVGLALAGAGTASLGFGLHARGAVIIRRDSEAPGEIDFRRR